MPPPQEQSACPFPDLQGDGWMINSLMPPDQSRPSAKETVVAKHQLKTRGAFITDSNMLVICIETKDV